MSGSGPVREPVVAGMFYEGDRSGLSAHLGKLFSGARKRKPAKGKDYGMVVSPHAGYVYSGRTAAHAISSLRKAGSYVILGPNHTGIGAMFSVMSDGSWRTPLGDVKIDGALAGRIRKLGFAEEDGLAHMREHSIEVQLPFLQHRFRDFRFVPVCIMNTGYSDGFLKECEKLGKLLAGLVKDGSAGVVASSDFSHYLSQQSADEKDGAAMERIMKLDVKGFFSCLEETDASICGFGPIAVTMAAAKELALKPELIHKSSSGDETGDYRSVVSYYAIGFG